MNKKLILLEIVSALVMAAVLAVIFLALGATIGGNMDIGYEIPGMFGVIFGLPIGGILGAYLVRRRFKEAEQKTSSAILIGLLIGIILLSINFAKEVQVTHDQLRYNAGSAAIESLYPEMNDMDCFASCSFEYDKEGSDYYFAYIVHGSGVPIVKATCFKFDEDSQVTKIGEYPNPDDSYNFYQGINPMNCTGVKKIPESKQLSTTNFEECKHAGHPIIGHDPEKCQMPDGTIFADDVVGFEKCRDAGHAVLDSDPQQCEGSYGVLYANKNQNTSN